MSKSLNIRLNMIILVGFIAYSNAFCATARPIDPTLDVNILLKSSGVPEIVKEVLRNNEDELKRQTYEYVESCEYFQKLGLRDFFEENIKPLLIRKLDVCESVSMKSREIALYDKKILKKLETSENHLTKVMASLLSKELEKKGDEDYATISKGGKRRYHNSNFLEDLKVAIVQRL